MPTKLEIKLKLGVGSASYSAGQPLESYIKNTLETKLFEFQYQKAGLRAGSTGVLELQDIGSDMKGLNLLVKGIVADFHKSQRAKGYFDKTAKELSDLILKSLNANARKKFSFIDEAIASIEKKISAFVNPTAAGVNKADKDNIWFELEEGVSVLDWLQTQGGSAPIPFKIDTKIGSFFENFFLGQPPSNTVLPDIKDVRGVPILESKVSDLSQSSLEIGKASFKHLKHENPEVERQLNELLTDAVLILKVLEKAHSLLLLRTESEKGKREETANQWIRFRFLSAAIYSKLKVKEIFGNFFEDYEPSTGFKIHSFFKAKRTTPITKTGDTFGIPAYPELTNFRAEKDYLIPITTIPLEFELQITKGKRGLDVKLEDIYADKLDILEDPEIRFAFYTAMLEIQNSQKLFDRTTGHYPIWRRVLESQ